MVLGTVKFYDSKRGFGFISREDGKGDLYFHVSGLVDRTSEPKEGDPVMFELREGKRGLLATRVEVR